MNVPLGRAVGNAVEVAEAVEVLKGGGPADVVSLTVSLAREMLALAGLSSVDPAAVLASGDAYETWCRMIAAQGGDPAAALPEPSHVHVVKAPSSGVLASLDAYAVGVAAWRLGAGRARKEDPVQASAGILCLAKPGERVSAGDPLLELHTDTPDAVPSALAALEGAYTVADSAPDAGPIVLDTVRP
jgi:thymidine phosphorylase